MNDAKDSKNKDSKDKIITARLMGVRTAPRKVSLVADSIRGIETGEAERRLNFMVKRFSVPILKLLKSAVSSARSKGIGGQLKISEIQVGKGQTLKRFRAGSRGSPRSILKYTSNIKLSLKEYGTKD
ncbi:50S ribosomal protein L22 [candidate division WWE3 bacterium CG08_land_8_20_14_0_20_40_13]|uniref:50S ribosomal protein L22 n=1 Tax=candidate division WWE3 bacterium CG08_land_8_20_14_0_20_40_13 TaxID=1975084 RepID=A0A2H0XEJ7_UNCKA|nr:MAG: 50S ribosomal protein L22 [candidate division WWE3 bacterium CG08_land_8_20_14_0_20_40_13]